MKKFGEALREIYYEDRGILILMIINFLLSLVLFVFAIVKMNPEVAVVKIGYGDIGGYRDGLWTDLIMFPLAAILFGVLHSFLALKIFEKRGGGMVKFFLITTTMLIMGAMVVLLRITEGV